MTTDERYAEIGRMVEERKDVRSRRACIRNRILRTHTFLGRALKEMDGSASVLVAMTLRDESNDEFVPSEIQTLLDEERALRQRLAELDKFLSSD